MSDPGGGSSMQQLVPVAPSADAPGGGGGGKELAVVAGTAGRSSAGGVKLREDEEDLEVKLRRIMENVPVRVSNTSGSSAGSGSGDFHQRYCGSLLLACLGSSLLSSAAMYRQMRRREQDRLARMDADYQKRKEMAEFNLRREERLKAAEERTAKKRLKRQKKKQRTKEKRAKTSDGGEEPYKVQSSDDNDGSDVDDDKT